jgi:hypothetical protein
MKKFNLVLAALLVLSAVAFAQAVEPAVTVSGNASVTFGYNLDTKVFGVSNAASGSFKVELVASSTVTEGEGDLVGYISLAGFGASGSNGDIAVTAPTVTAKVLVGPAYVDITSAGNKIDMASMGMGKTFAFVDGDGDPVGVGNSFDPDEEFAGIAVGTDLGVATVEVGFTSEYDWIDSDTSTDESYRIEFPGYVLDDDETWVGLDDGAAPDTSTNSDGDTQTDEPVMVTTAAGADEATDNVGNNYNFYVKASLLAIDGLTLDVMAAQEGVTGQYGFGAKAGYSLAIGDYTASAMLGVDYVTSYKSSATNVSATEIGAGLMFAVPGSGMSVPGSADFAGVDYESVSVSAGLGLGFGMNLASDGDWVGHLNVTLAEGDIVPVADIAGYFGIVNAFDGDRGQALSAVYVAGIKVAADLGVLNPYAAYYLGTDPFVDTEAGIEVGTDVMVVENVTFTLKYDSGDLALDGDLGVITFTTKIAY